MQLSDDWSHWTQVLSVHLIRILRIHKAWIHAVRPFCSLQGLRYHWGFAPTLAGYMCLTVPANQKVRERCRNSVPLQGHFGCQKRKKSAVLEKPHHYMHRKTWKHVGGGKQTKTPHPILCFVVWLVPVPTQNLHLHIFALWWQKTCILGCSTAFAEARLASWQIFLNLVVLGQTQTCSWMWDVSGCRSSYFPQASDVHSGLCGRFQCKHAVWHEEIRWPKLFIF